MEPKIEGKKRKITKNHDDEDDNRICFPKENPA